MISKYCQNIPKTVRFFQIMSMADKFPSEATQVLSEVPLDYQIWTNSHKLFQNHLKFELILSKFPNPVSSFLNPFLTGARTKIVFLSPRNSITQNCKNTFEKLKIELDIYQQTKSNSLSWFGRNGKVCDITRWERQTPGGISLFWLTQKEE